MSDTFSVSDERLSDDLGVVVLGGEVDIHTAPQFRKTLLGLLDDGVTRLTVDLSEVTFIDSTALGVLIGGVRRLHVVGGAMTIVVTGRPVERVLGITGLDRVFSMHATREEAVAALS